MQKRSSTHPAWLTVAIPIAILWLALGVRLAALSGHYLWFDEAGEFNVANRPLGEVIAADQAGTLDPPLYSILLNLWLNISRQDLAVQLLSVFFSLAALATLMRLARYLLSPAAAIVAGMLAAVVPRSVFFGIEVNQYALVFWLSALLMLLLERYLRTPVRRRLAIFVAVSMAGILTHHELDLYLATLAAIGTLRLLAALRTTPRRIIIDWIGALIALAIFGGLWLVVYVLPQNARMPDSYTPAFFASAPPATVLVEQGLAQVVGLLSYTAWGTEWPGPWWPVAMLLIIGSAVTISRRRSAWLTAYLVVGLIVSYVISGLGFLAFWGRYVWYAFPLIVLLIAAALTLAPKPHWQRRWTPGGTVLACAIGLLLIARLPFASGVPFAETEQLGEVVQYVEPRRQSGDVVYVYYGARPIFNRYASAGLQSSATIETWARGKPLEERTANLWQVAAGHRVWLLMSHVAANEGRDLAEYLTAHCPLLDQIEPIGAAGYLFDCQPR